LKLHRLIKVKCSKAPNRVGIRNSTDYSPFGVELDGRTVSLDGYRFGFQNQEKDDEISGHGKSYTADFWQYSPCLGRRWNIDPVVKEHRSPYDVFSNNPIIMVDPNGDDDYYNSDGSYNTKMSQKYNNNGTHNIYVLSADGKNKTLLADMPLKTANQIAIVEKVISGYAKNAGIYGKVKLVKLNEKSTVVMAKTIAKRKSSKLISNDVIVNSNGGMNDYLSNYHNLVSTLFHENLHQKDNKKGQFYDDDTFEGLMQHVEVYKKQIEHSSFISTSKDFKEGTIRSFGEFLESTLNEINDSFDSRGDLKKLESYVNHFNANEGKKYGFIISWQVVSNAGESLVYEVKVKETKK
jgi:RHS repeat-associated protein